MIDDTLIHMATQHTFAVQSWLSSRSPDAARFQGLGVRASSTGYPAPLLNLALGATYPANTAEDVIDGEIDAVITFFARRAVPFLWWLGPHCCPAKMDERLLRHGLRRDKPLLPAMAAALSRRDYLVSPAICVWQAKTGADLAAASLIRQRAFRFPPGPLNSYFEACAEDWLRGDPARLYLAGFDHDAPAAIGACIMGKGYPGVYVMATLPEMRQRGLAKAIMARLLSDAAAEGHSHIFLTASSMGYPLYQLVGFQHIFDFVVFNS